MSANAAILVVDDERNIRSAFAAALAPLGREVVTAVNGEDALERLRDRQVAVVLIDLRMPGMNGIEALRRIRAAAPGAAVVVVTAHGTIEDAVEAMKLGALDFVEKPCSPQALRDIVQRALQRPLLVDEDATDYFAKLEMARRHIAERRLDEAADWVRRAIGEDPARPDAYNLLGAVVEQQGDELQAQKYYRAALDQDPAYPPARVNLERIAGVTPEASIQLGDTGGDRDAH